MLRACGKSGCQRREIGFQAVDGWLQQFCDARNSQNLVEQFVEPRHQWTDQSGLNLARVRRQLSDHITDLRPTISGVRNCITSATRLVAMSFSLRSLY